MGILKKIFGNGSNERKSGIYVVEQNGLKELDEHPGNGSINAIINELGFKTNQVHTVMTFDSKNISNIGFKIFSNQPLFALTNDGVKNLKLQDLQKEVRQIDWDFEYSSSEIEEILSEGVKEQNLSYDFLNTVTKLSPKTDKTYFANSLDLLLNFENGILSSFSSTDGLTSDSKYLKNLNQGLFNSMMNEAKQFQNSQNDILLEINNQCKALRSIPEATNNPYLQEHQNKFGNYNFYNLWAAHYTPPFSIEEFKVVNKGRFVNITDNQLKVDSFYYEFDENGILSNSWK